MKKIIRQAGIVCTVAIVFMLGMAIPGTAGAGAEPAFAAETSGTFHGVAWEITAGGALQIGTAGETSTFTGLDWHEALDYFPWCADDNKGKVKSVKFLGTVKAEEFANINDMFFGLANCMTVDMSNFTVDQAGSMSHMFAGCEKITSLDLSGIKSAGTYMYGMFMDCHKLKSVVFGDMDTSRVEQMISMFRSCKALTDIDLTGFDTSSLYAVNQMFFECNALQRLDLSSFDGSRIQEDSWYNFLDACPALISLNTPKNVKSGSNVKLTNPMKDAQGKVYNNLPEESVSILLTRTASAVKKANPMTVGVSSKTYKSSSLKKARSFNIGVKKAQGSVTYTLNAKAKKAGLKVSAKGKVTVPKKCKKGTYKITVKAAGKGSYKSASKTVKVVVK